jgi:hypothetical protein
MHKPRRVPNFGIFLFLITFLLTACGGGGGGGDSSGGGSSSGGESGTTSETMITPAGGTATSTDGKVTLVFPAGALASENTITIKNLALEDVPSEFEGLEGDTYEFGPDGLNFDVPITLTFEPDENPIKADGEIGATFLFPVTNGDGPLAILDGVEHSIDTVAGKITVSALMNHFSESKMADFEVTVSSTEPSSAGPTMGINLVAPSTVVVNDPFQVEFELEISQFLDSIDTIQVSHEDQSSNPPLVTDQGKVYLQENFTRGFVNYTCTEVTPAANVILRIGWLFEDDENPLTVVFPFAHTRFAGNITVAATIDCVADDGSGNEDGALWTQVESITSTSGSGIVGATTAAIPGGKTVTVTMGGPIPENIHDDGFDRAHVELKFLRNGAPVTAGGLGTQKLDFFSNDSAWRSCTHLNENALPFTPDNGDTCSLSGDTITFVWDQPDNCFDRLEFYIQAVGGEGGSSDVAQDLDACP